MGREVTIHFPPKRIVSLVPSQTELLFDLGLDLETVGVTRFCIHPEESVSKTKIIGGTKKFNFEIIDELKPDLIIGNKEENYREGIEVLMRKYPVWMSDIVTFKDALTMIQWVGELTDRKSKAIHLIDSIEQEFEGIKPHSEKSVLYLIWRKPWMAAGTGTFIDSMLKCIGLQNALHDTRRYPELTRDQIRKLKPDFIFLSTEPYPFTEKHIEELRTISDESTIIIVDGEMFSWYGSRLLKAPRYFNQLILQ